MITPALSTPAMGMADASRRFDAAASNVAGAAPATTDVATELVTATVIAPRAYTANATMLRAADETRGSLLDILA
jgi:hypothetical protein